jgi:uncharacterized protein
MIPMNFPMRFLKAYKLPVFKLLAIGFLISLCSGLYAQNLPERPNPPRLVNDFANILTKEQAQKLEDKLVAFDDSTSNQIAIVTMSDLNGVPASAMAPELFIKWGIGHTGRDNGILVLVSMSNPREVFINTGYGVESYVTDAMAGRIVQEHLIPRFKENDYFGGLDLATNDLMQLLQGSFKGFGKKKEKAPFPPIIFVILIIIVVIIISRNSKGGGGRYMRTFGGPFPGSYGGYGRSGGFGGFGGFGGGSSGGGFGGFGGGSTGGGGAGGSW